MSQDNIKRRSLRVPKIDVESDEEFLTSKSSEPVLSPRSSQQDLLKKIEKKHEKEVAKQEKRLERELTKSEKEEKKWEKKLRQKGHMEDVTRWIASLGLPTAVADKYVELFESEEIYSIEQVFQLTEKHLHDWMGVKTGTTILMMQSINQMNQAREDGSKSGEEETLPLQTNRISENKVFQAGGHGGVVRVKPGFVKKKTDTAEASFYINLQSDTKIPEDVKQTWFPKFNSVEKGPMGKRSIVLEDLTDGFILPCVMDVKMGTQTFGEDANMIKKNFMISKDKSTTTVTYGLRIVAARTYKIASKTWTSITRSDAASISTVNSLEEVLKLFFDNGSLRGDVISYYLAKLKSLEDWMKIQHAYRFYSSSLLFVYEGDLSVDFKAAVKMIDFAHVYEIKDGGLDDGYLKGIRNLITFFEKFIQDSPQTKQRRRSTSSTVREKEKKVVNSTDDS